MTTIGMLSKYINPYTNCINSCDFFYTDKTNRLGYDNVKCLLKCNDIYTQYRKNNYYNKIPLSIHEYLNYIPCNPYKYEECYGRKLGLLGCEIDKKFMTRESYEKCRNRFLY